MNYIKHLTGFFDRIVQDADLNPTHISLYIGLFQFWNINRFRNPISITRDEVMRISKIASKATYHKCMKDLHSKGYVKYEPSYNPFKGSMVIFYNFAEDPQPVQKKARPPQEIPPNNEQALNKSQTGQQTGSEQALVPSINTINNTNFTKGLNLEASAKIENTSYSLTAEILKEKKSSAKKKELPDTGADVNYKSSFQVFPESGAFEIKSKTVSGSQVISVPSLEDIKIYFAEQSYPDIEAQKFFNHYSSNGWMIGGKSPMVDWKAAAQNWMINAPKFHGNQTDDRAKQLSVDNNKNYAEPL